MADQFLQFTVSKAAWSVINKWLDYAERYDFGGGEMTLAEARSQIQKLPTTRPRPRLKGNVTEE